MASYILGIVGALMAIPAFVIDKQYWAALWALISLMWIASGIVQYKHIAPLKRRLGEKP